MTLVSQIITDAYRQSNILAIGTVPTTAQVTEALRYLNRIVQSVFGNEVGEELQAFPIGRTGIDRPQGYPYYDQTPSGDWFVPKNARLMLNLSAALSVFLHPKPDDGTRFAISDILGNLNTFNLTVDGNGRTIEDAATIVLNTPGANTEWFYRQDLGNWVKYSTLIESDTFPFPEAFDDYFITMLAMRLNPAYGAVVDQQSVAIMNRTKTQLRARYNQTIEEASEDGLLRLSKSSRDRDLYTNRYGDSSASFDRGWPNN